MKGEGVLIIKRGAEQVYQREIEGVNFIEKKIGLDSKVYLFDPKTGKEYGERRIIGGLAWPHIEKPGFAVVVAEERFLDMDLDARHIRVLAEVEAAGAADLNRLFRRCLEFQERCLGAVRWFGDTGNLPMMDFLRRFNDEQGENKLSLFAGKYIDDPNGLRAYIGAITELTEPNRKILHFGETAKLPAYLTQFQKEDVTRSAREFPAIAALGYAVTDLYFNKPYQRRGTDKPAWRRTLVGPMGKGTQ
jgi:hypothetical protein